jgi:regulator of cell morphogenesis and NO signaling
VSTLSLNITPETPVGDIVVAFPVLSREFEALGIDFCCGGNVPLGVVCARKNISVTETIAKLRAACGQTTDDPALSENGSQPKANAPLTEWVEYIQATHHEYLWKELPALAQLVEKVARVHGGGDARLVEIGRLFPPFAGELMQHMQKEEQILFPMIAALESGEEHAGSHCGGIQNPIRQMNVEHDEAGAVLKQIRQLTSGFAVPEWACNSYRAMLERLHHLETDLTTHMHLETHLVFPRAQG